MARKKLKSTNPFISGFNELTMDTIKTCRVWYVPHGGKPTFRNGMPEGFRATECLTISPELSVLYNITQNTPNATLAEYGQILSNIPGDAVIVYENDEGIRDIPENFLDALPKVLREDMDKRQKFMAMLEGTSTR